MRKIFGCFIFLFLMAHPLQALEFNEFKIWADQFLTQNQGEPAQAIKLADEVLSGNPNLEPTLANYVRLVKVIAYMNLGNFAEAMAVAKENADAQPGIVYPLIVLSDMQASIGAYQEAISSLESANSNRYNQANLNEIANQARAKQISADDYDLRKEADRHNIFIEERLQELKTMSKALFLDDFWVDLKNKSSFDIKDLQGQIIAVTGIVDIILDDDKSIILILKGNSNPKKLEINFQEEKAQIYLATYRPGNQITVLGTFSSEDNLKNLKIQDPYTLGPLFIKLNNYWD